VNEKVNDMERIIREFKESNGRMMKTLSEQFAQLAISNREKRVFPSQPEVNPRGSSSSFFDTNDVRKVNAVIALWSGKKVDTHVGEQVVNESLSPSSSLPSPQGDDVCLSPMTPIPSKDLDEPKESRLMILHLLRILLILLLVLLDFHLLSLTS